MKHRFAMLLYANALPEQSCRSTVNRENAISLRRSLNLMACYNNLLYWTIKYVITLHFVFLLLRIIPHFSLNIVLL